MRLPLLQFHRRAIGGLEQLMKSAEKNGSGLRRLGRRGSELLEFTYALLPLLAIMFVMVDISWSIFVKATLQFAVHQGLRHGITITKTQATTAGQTLTQMVQNDVETWSMGILRGSTGKSYINLKFYALDSTGNLVLVSGTGANVSPNLMQVSVDSYPLAALVPRLYSWAVPPDSSPGMISATAADEVEPSNDVPPI